MAAYLLYLPQDFASVGAVVVSAALSIANFKFMQQGSYFEASADAQPLLHLWSLSVEEQFYLVYPCCVLLAYRLRVAREKLAGAMSLLALLSFVGCVMLTRSNPAWAFYLLPTRAWELLAGCVLATRPSGNRRLGDDRQSARLSNLGLITIVGSLVFISEGRAFPGYVAAFPVLGTVLLIGGGSQSFAERMLSRPWPVFIGKASYSLYLWHWPIYCFVDYSLYASPLTVRTALKVLLSVSIALASYQWFECPLRGYLNQPLRQRAALAAFAMGVAAFVAAGLSIRNENYVNARFETVKDGGIVYNPTTQRPAIVLMGDSNASMYGTAFKQIAAETGARVHVISVAAGEALPESKLFDDSLAFLERTKPDITVFVAAWKQKIGDDHPRFELALEKIAAHSQAVILITQPPVLPDYATRQSIREFGRRAIFEVESFGRLRTATNAFLLAHRSERIHVLDIEPLFKTADGEIRFTDAAGHLLYYDKRHLSGFGGELVKQQLLVEISKLLAREGVAPSGDASAP